MQTYTSVTARALALGCVPLDDVDVHFWVSVPWRRFRRLGALRSRQHAFGGATKRNHGRTVA